MQKGVSLGSPGREKVFRKENTKIAERRQRMFIKDTPSKRTVLKREEPKKGKGRLNLTSRKRNHDGGSGGEDEGAKAKGRKLEGE